LDPWHDLLSLVASHPRENGTAALQRMAVLLGEALEAGGLDARYAPFDAHPMAPALHGMLGLLAGILFVHAVRGRRPGVAFLVGLVPSLLLLIELGAGVPLLGRLGSTTQAHVGAVVAPAREARARVVLLAHYDTRTDLLPHAAWRVAAGGAAAAAVVALLVSGTLALRRSASARRAAGLAALSGGLAGALGFGVLTGGLFVPRRSPGAADDGGSVAVLLRAAAALESAGPAARFRFLEVEIALLSGEELTGEGSRRFAVGRFATPPDIPTAAFVLHQIGAGAGLALHGTGSAPGSPGPDLGRAVREAAAALGIELARDGAEPGCAPRALRDRGIPAAALVGVPGAEHAHRPADRPEHLDRHGLDRALALVLEGLCRLDRDLATGGADGPAGEGGAGAVCYRLRR